jgi:GntR family transcriptional regulator
VTISPEIHLATRKIQRDCGQALFSQLEEIIRDGIENIIWSPGQAIPSERELSNLYGLSRMTVRKALDRLVAAGLLFRVDGKGTFVSQPKVKFKALSLAGLREQTLNIGYSPSAKLISVDKVLANEKIASVLKIEPDTPVYLIERVVFGNNVPLGLHRSHIPVDLCPNLQAIDLSNISLYSVLRRDYGIVINRASETLESTLATTRESLLLSVEPGYPMFLLRIVMSDASERPIEYVKVVFRGDRVQLSLDL